MVSVPFDNVSPAKPGFDFKGCEGPIDAAIKMILAVSQVIFNLSFKLCSICNNSFFSLYI